MSKPLNILIAEDEPIIASILENLAEEEGHHVCGIVDQGAKVFETVHALKPDVVLMDVHLADGVTGIQVTRELLHLLTVPVIIISGTDSPEELQEIAASGALGFMKKPVVPDELRVNLRIAARHHEMMERIRISEILHRSIFDGAAVGIYICHRDGYYIASNRAFAAMLGYAGPAQILRDIKSVDDQIYVKEGRRDAFLDVLDTGKTVNDAESQVYGRDGDMLWISEHLVPYFNEHNVMTHYEGVAIDISDKKIAEEQRNLAFTLMKVTMDAIADYVVVTDLDGYVMYANKAFERDFGSQLGDERELVLEGSGQQCPWHRFQNDLDLDVDKGYQVRGTCRLQHSSMPLNVGITRYLSPQGDIVGAVFVMRAIHEDAPWLL